MPRFFSQPSSAEEGWEKNCLGVRPIKKNKNASVADAQTLTLWQAAAPYLFSVVFFTALCLLSSATAKTMVVLTAFSLLAAAFSAFGRVRARLTPPLLALAAYVLMDILSTQYAIAGKFALYETMKVFSSFCLTLLLLTVAPGKGERAARWSATVLACAAALGGLVSIDLLSTRVLSGAVLGLLRCFTTDFGKLAGVEAGVRMTSMFTNPNVFAGVAGIGVLLSLVLATTAGGRRERAANCALLYVNSLAFVLAFSMGATLSIVPAFLILLLTARSERRSDTLALMLETFVLVLAAALVISRTSFGAWDGPDAIPLLCTIFGAAALAAADRRVGAPWARGRTLRGRAVFAALAVMACAIAAFAALAWNLTGPATLEAGGGLRRAAYPAAGGYTLRVDADAPVEVRIESKNRLETMMHTSTELYSGSAAGAAFTVPEGSLAVFFNFTAPQGARLASVTYEGTENGKVPLNYRLLPGFIANRLQGLLANENAIQRFVFFSDGMKLFRRSPLIGLGMGSFENGIKSVQPFFYETKYAHNHYIQTLVETGIVGLALFLALLLLSARAVLRSLLRPERPALSPALAAALAFMALHAMVELVFSAYAYLPMAYGVIALTGILDEDAAEKPMLGKHGRSALLAGICAVAAAFSAMVVGNVWALKTVAANATFESLERGARMDRFEWADYLLTYVQQSTTASADDEVRRKAEDYAQKLSETESNSLPFYLAQYYFTVGEREKAFSMLEKYVSYVASDEETWNGAFHLMAQWDDGGEAYRAEALRLYARMEEWNAANLGVLVPDEASQAYLEQYLQ